jgi:hypothetical protein
MLRFVDIATVSFASTLAFACTNVDTTDSTTAASGSEGTESAEVGETGCNYDLLIGDCTDTMVVCQADENDPGTIFEESGACIWPLLRDRTAGSWIEIVQNPGDSSTSISLLVAQDGAIMRQVSHYINGTQCSPIEPMQGCTLQNPTFFQACLGMVTPECLAYEGWFTDCAMIDTCL